MKDISFEEIVSLLETKIQEDENKIHDLLAEGYKPIWRELDYSCSQIQEKEPYQYNCNQLVMLVNSVCKYVCRLEELKSKQKKFENEKHSNDEKSSKEEA